MKTYQGLDFVNQSILEWMLCSKGLIWCWGYMINFVQVIPALLDGISSISIDSSWTNSSLTPNLSIRKRIVSTSLFFSSDKLGYLEFWFPVDDWDVNGAWVVELRGQDRYIDVFSTWTVIKRGGWEFTISWC